MHNPSRRPCLRRYIRLLQPQQALKKSLFFSGVWLENDEFNPPQQHHSFFRMDAGLHEINIFRWTAVTYVIRQISSSILIGTICLSPGPLAKYGGRGVFGIALLSQRQAFAVRADSHASRLCSIVPQITQIITEVGKKHG
ncbi:hypothetical protein FHW96_001562 [Novosphingobium sp. SG751A]|uniref:hypothetical protein n=1 Tax=Novosphingobium sp. SG751A TaxID=2587000 RepID=UPI00155673F3|nr:hypothetical protein [Novosphingobium sp. SG751A]NOW45407.1 hypothetical protein [Novosphingobium sp. SG751A]